MFWQIVSAGVAVIGSLGGLWGLLKYRQAWQAGFQAGQLAAATREAERGKRRQRIDSEVGRDSPDELERRLRDGSHS